jgi:hypothetical protein
MALRRNNVEYMLKRDPITGLYYNEPVYEEGEYEEEEPEPTVNNDFLAGLSDDLSVLFEEVSTPTPRRGRKAKQC